VAIAGPDYD
jgi:hypothetical protein